tara:strand:- start:2341 stop:2568 length:228 start_codon:yes stop_codon:yes gene_type:complete
MKISNIIIAAAIFLLASCNGNQTNEHGLDAQEHGHEHGEGEQHHEQEEFTMSGDSVKVEEPTHYTHEDGSEHHNH